MENNKRDQNTLEWKRDMDWKRNKLFLFFLRRRRRSGKFGLGL